MATDVRLSELRLRRFKGLAEFTLAPDGADCSVFADNDVGKTTLADAWSWLLTDKDSAGRKDFDIKTIDPKTGEVLHGLEYEVQGALALSGEQKITLRKVYAEKYTKRRGSATAEFTGHTTTHQLDGVPVNKGEYDAAVAKIADEHTLRLLGDPGYFSGVMHWQERRKLLLQVCGDVTDAEVIASSKELAELPDILGKRKLDDHKKTLKSRCAEINKELERIPVRIDEATNGLPETGEADEPGLREQLETLRERRESKAEERTRIQSGGEVAEKRKRLAEIAADMNVMRQYAQGAINQQVQAEQVCLNELRDEIGKMSSAISRSEREAADAARDIERTEAQRQKLLAKWYEVDAQTFSHDQEDTCAACGQALPADQVQAAHDKAQAAFNESKAEALEKIADEGQRCKARLEELQVARDGHQDAIKKGTGALEDLQEEEARLRAAIEETKAKAPDPSEQPEYKKLAAEKAEVEQAVASLQTGNAEQLAAVAERIVAFDAAIAETEQNLSRFEQRRKGEARIQELKSEERKLAAEFEELERQLFLCDSFVRAKVAMLTDRINSRFELARFRLFDVLVNGGVDECCEVLCGGVPYTTALNTGARVRVGLDIIKTLQDHYELKLPVWIDSRESITRIPDMDCQVINLIASLLDKQLRVEVAQREAVPA